MAATLLVAVACSAGAGSPAPADPTAPKADAAWRTATLVDTRTGETFSVDSLRGKLVAIEPMAVWCSNCKIQQQEASSALARMNDPSIVYVSVDLDPNEREKDLADYAERSGFDWRFVIATTEVARSLAATFGDQVLSPPSTPLILVGPDGDVVDQHFGIRGADDLVELFSQYLS
jgi:thiol-disulfide isomerase/thioredoxin